MGSKRQANREEDNAYSLVGYFSIYVPLPEREGSDSALVDCSGEFEKPTGGESFIPNLELEPCSRYHWQNIKRRVLLNTRRKYRSRRHISDRNSVLIGRNPGTKEHLYSRLRRHATSGNTR
jgi:hypothetical protein